MHKAKLLTWQENMQSWQLKVRQASYMMYKSACPNHGCRSGHVKIPNSALLAGWGPQPPESPNREHLKSPDPIPDSEPPIVHIRNPISKPRKSQNDFSFPMTRIQEHERTKSEDSKPLTRISQASTFLLRSAAQPLQTITSSGNKHAMNT